MKESVALYAGGFKPPHKAHFENANILGKRVNKLIIFIGPVVREGIRITPEQSKEIWEIYSKYLTIPTEVFISKVTPVRDIYEFVDANQNKYSEIITGAMSDEMRKFAYFEKNKEKYPNVSVLELPVMNIQEGKFSATVLRTQARYLNGGKWIPDQVTKEDKESIIDIVNYESTRKKSLLETERSNEEHIRG